MSRLLYTLLFRLALPAIVLRLIWRSIKEPGYRRHILQRFGWRLPKLPQVMAHAPIWVHAVSAGETRAAIPLIQALQAQYPNAPILVTTMTATGAQTAQQLLGDDVIRSFAPYDLPGCLRRFLKHFTPCVCILIETEVWPNLIATCETVGVPVVLASARMSEQSLKKALRFESLARPAFGAIAQILAQTESDAQRLHLLGAHNLHVCGNMKYDFPIPDDQLAQAKAWRAALPHKHVVCIASSREGEEQQFIEALATQPLPPNTLLVIVPRHPQRFDEVGQLLRKNNLAYTRRSGKEPIRAHCNVLLGDTMGEMFFYYGASDVVIMGGSFAPLGGQNPIEAMSLGCPVLFGPHTFNFSQVCKDAVSANAAVRVATPAAALSGAFELLGLLGSQRTQQMRAAATDQVSQHQGAVQRMMFYLSALIA